MCGFCGIVLNHPERDIEGRAKSMTATLAHRGPDADGVRLLDPCVALGHRRLSIIDLSEAGAQPMTKGDPAITLSYNGEVYNFQELRTELESLGSRFVGGSDTEVVLEAYRAWGLEGLSRLEGIFGLALWDSGQRRLVLQRDRFGVKPLFWARNPEGVAFGSEIKAVMASGLVGSDLDEQAFSEYMWYGNAFLDRTIYRDVRQLEAGHRLVLDGDQCRVEPWFRLEDWLAPSERAFTPEAVRVAVDEAVSRQMVADVPIGVFLSGGVDSSVVAAAAVAASAQPVASYAVGFDFEFVPSELPKARRVADVLGLDHHEIMVRGSDIESLVLRMVRAHDEPFADAANIPLFLLCEALGGDRKVVLQGDGGDEMFAGYRRYSELDRRGLWSLWPGAVSGVARRLGGARGRRFVRMAEAAGAVDAGMRMALLLTLETLQDPPTGFLTADRQSDLAARTDPFQAFQRAAERFSGFEPIQQMLLCDLMLQLPSQFLPKVDRATMAVGVEARVPLLDERVAELAVGMPAAHKIRGDQRKIILRDAYRDVLPTEILDGPKTGFGVPYSRWLQGALFEPARATVLDPRVASTFGLDVTKLERAFVEHRDGVRDWGFLLWKLYQLGLWHTEVRP